MASPPHGMTEDQGLALVMQVVSENSAAIRLVESLTKNRKKLGLPEGMSVDLALYIISLQRELIGALVSRVEDKEEILELKDTIDRFQNP